MVDRDLPLRVDHLGNCWQPIAAPYPRPRHSRSRYPPDGVGNWTPVFSTTTGTGGTQTIPVAGTGRFIRMYGTTRATGYGYSIFEFSVYSGSTASPSPHVINDTGTAAVASSVTPHNVVSYP
jgi:hypothetical protein